MLTEKDVLHIAQLARIDLKKKNLEQFKKEISSILNFVELLNEVPTEDVEPLYSTVGFENAPRKDEPRGDFSMDENLNKQLIDQAPHKQERFIKVKSVFKR